MGIPTKLSDKSGCPGGALLSRAQSLARRRARNIVQVDAHALNGSWECYHAVRIGLGAIWGDHGRRRSLHFTTPPILSEKGVGIPTLSISPKKKSRHVYCCCALPEASYDSRNILMSACRTGFATWAARNDIFALRRKCPASVFPADCANCSSGPKNPDSSV